MHPNREDTYMCHQCVVRDVRGHGRLWRFGTGWGLFQLGLLDKPGTFLGPWAWLGPPLLGRVAEDTGHTQLHLEVQEVIPGELKKQVLQKKKKGT